MIGKQISALFLFILLTLGGCGDGKEVAEQRAKLELAEIKGDLDAIYLSLNRLKEAGDKEAVSRFQKITDAIKIREKMELALSDHNHEDALIFASQLLEQVPNNKKAKKVIRESGQIFYYLQSAKTLLTQIQLKGEEVSVKPERVSFDPAVPEEEKQKNLTILIQKQLLQLDYDIGAPDGVAGENTISAIRRYQKEQALEVTGAITNSLANNLYDAIAKKKEEELREEKKIEDAERLYEGFRKAREYAKKAKELDPHFKGSLEFENSIEQTQASLVYIRGVEVVEAGQSVVSSAAIIYSSVSKLLGMAVSSEYLSIQSAWSSVEEVVDEAKEKLEPILARMDGIGRLLATYEDGSAKKFANATLEYIRIVRKTVDALMVPQGSYLDFSKAANDATTQYKDALNRLESSIPTSISIQESFSGLVKVMAEYNIYKKDETAKIVQNNVSLYKI